MIIEGAIFDVDGTLLDSMPVWHDAGLRYLKTLGIEGEAGLGDLLFSMTLEGSADYIKRTYLIDDSVENIMAGINKQMEDFYYNGAQLKSGARNLLDYFKERGVIMTVATSTDRYCIEAAFRRLNLMNYFRSIFTCTEVGEGKSHPKIFMEALNVLGTRPEHTWVFEDGLYSIKTAKKEGFKIAGVYDEVSAKDQDEIRQLSDLYVMDIDHIDFDFWRI